LTVLVPGEKAVLAKAPPWSKRKGTVWKRYHIPTSKAQIAQQQKLAKAAYSLYDRGLSRVDFIAAITPMLVGSTGGMSDAQRRSSRHALAGARIQARDKLISQAV
jgi:hypothetical protein